MLERGAVLWVDDMHISRVINDKQMTTNAPGVSIHTA